MQWNGSVVAITGASRGIGAAVARAAAARGARLALIARSAADLDTVLADSGGDGMIVAADVGDPASIARAMTEIEDACGHIDILVNNAGIGAWARFVDTDLDVLEDMMRVNLLGTIHATKAVVPGMIARGRGHLVTVASIAGRIGAPFEAGYSASKFAVAGFTEALRAELAPYGIGASLIDPGPVETAFFETRGVPYKRKSPKPVSAERVARAVIRAVERDIPEQYVPRWLRFPVVMKTLVPPLFRSGTERAFRDDLRQP